MIRDRRRFDPFPALRPSFGRWLLLVLVPLAGASGAFGAERQSHGFAFEERVRDHLFDRGYTDEWDIPGEANLVHPGIPVSVKYIRWGSPVYLGDAVRQRSIDHPFELVVGFYRDADGEKRTVAIHDLVIGPDRWESLWGSVSRGDLVAFSEKIRTGSIASARSYARGRAAELRDRSGGISINPKIDANQRRIQCSIPFTVFFEKLVRADPAEQDPPTLWGRPW